jgi:hypothetical protein
MISDRIRLHLYSGGSVASALPASLSDNQPAYRFGFGVSATFANLAITELEMIRFCFAAPSHTDLPSINYPFVAWSL